jgi:hypothetical protein
MELIVTIREILTRPYDNPNGWFYLPPNKDEWTLDTSGVFFSEDDDSSEEVPKQAKENGWVETLDNGTIEEIFDNLSLQLDSMPTEQQLFIAFMFYIENDAFIDCSVQTYINHSNSR